MASACAGGEVLVDQAGTTCPSEGKGCGRGGARGEDLEGCGRGGVGGRDL